MDGYVVAKQVIKSATSTAANYRAACRARSPNDFASKISVVSEEADESQFWLDLTIAARIVSDREAERLLAESSELSAIFTASRDTAKSNLSSHPSRGATVVALLVILAIMAILALLAMRERL